MAEHAAYNANRAEVLGDAIKKREASVFTRDELATARNLYVDLSNMLCDHRIFTHGLRKENLMLVEWDGELQLRMFDFKTIVYRQLISPHYVPGARLYEQRRKIAEVLASFDSVLNQS
jgi:hypothetical protein